MQTNTTQIASQLETGLNNVGVPNWLVEYSIDAFRRGAYTKEQVIEIARSHES